MLVKESFSSYRKVCCSYQNDWTNHIPIPELVICGNQGSGKKTLMENIVAYPIPSKLALPVRCCLRSTAAQMEIEAEAEVVDSKSGASCCARRRIAGRDLASSCYKELMEEAAGYAKTAGILVSSMTLNVHLTSPSNPCLDVVLFPGLLAFTQTDDEKQAEALIRDHIAAHGSRSFYLLAVEGSMRLNTALIMRSFTNRDDVRTVNVTVNVCTCLTLHDGSVSMTLCMLYAIILTHVLVYNKAPI
jgi:hypothetical protein